MSTKDDTVVTLLWWALVTGLSDVVTYNHYHNAYDSQTSEGNDMPPIASTHKVTSLFHYAVLWGHEKKKYKRYISTCRRSMDPTMPDGDDPWEAPSQVSLPSEPYLLPFDYMIKVRSCDKSKKSCLNFHKIYGH